jgi:hypothetical protein
VRVFSFVSHVFACPCDRYIIIQYNESQPDHEAVPYDYISNEFRSIYSWKSGRGRHSFRKRAGCPIGRRAWEKRPRGEKHNTCVARVRSFARAEVAAI